MIKTLFKQLIWIIPLALILTALSYGLEQSRKINEENAVESRFYYFGFVDRVNYISSYDSYKVYFTDSKPIIVSNLNQSPDMLIGNYCEFVIDGNDNLIHLVISDNGHSGNTIQ
jgi:hypothetical protein